MTKVRYRLRLVAPQQRPLLPLTLAEKRAAVSRDFAADPWIVGEGPRYFSPDRLASMAAENEARRRERGK